MLDSRKSVAASDQREAGSAPGTRTRLSFGYRVAVGLGAILIRLLGMTWRIRILHNRVANELSRADHIRVLREAGPVVYTLWHGQMLPILYAHGVRTGILISEHKDGEIISRIAEYFGCFGVRGSSSKGGTRALLEAASTIKSGTPMAFTPDGPRGPRHSYAPGALILAHRTGVPIVSITAHASSAWRLGSWDRFEIPKPFSRVTVSYALPRWVGDSDVRAAAARAGEFGALMLEDLAWTAEKAGASG